MDGIILELQRDAIDENIDINALLRKAYLVSYKLKLNDFEEWIRQEQEGYNGEIPKYRYISGSIKALNPMHGWIPVMFTPDIEEIVSKFPMPNSISAIYDLYNSGEDQSIAFTLPSDLIESLNKTLPVETTYNYFSSKSELFRIINTVRNKVLDWSLLLEENGVIGEGLSFSEKELKTVKESQVINNFTNNFYSDVTGVEIKQEKA